MATFKKKTLVVSCGVAFLVSFTPANAGFLNDMYDEMSANANVNAPKAYNTQTMGVISGGGIVWKTPVKTFTPFSVTPPHLKAGCGGIDAFLGSFGFVNKDEFVQMLRALGQNAAGLLFQLALKAMSPELSSEIENFSKTVQEWVRKFQNSCEMAQWMVDSSGAGKVAEDMGRLARRTGVAAGIFADDSDAKYETAKDGSKVYDNIQSVSNSGGKKVFDKDMNITWAALNSGSFSGLGDSSLEVIQALLGTVVIKWEGTADAKVPKPIRIPANTLSSMEKWVGDINENAVVMPAYTCDDNYTDCLDVGVTTATATEPSIAHRVYLSLKELRQAIIERRAPAALPDGTDPLAIVGMTSLPVGKLVNIASSVRYGFVGDHILESYSRSIAVEIASRILQSVLIETDKAIATQKLYSSDASGELKELRQHIHNMGKAIGEKGNKVAELITQQGIMVAQIEQMEKAMYAGLTMNVVNSMRFSGR